MTKLDDTAVRIHAFRWLEATTDQLGDVLPRTLLLEGFRIGGRRVPLISPAAGIFKPAVLEAIPLSINTSPRDPYGDRFGNDHTLHYRYRGTDPHHPDNRGLAKSLVTRTPLVYFHGIVPGKYLAVWPVYVVGDDPTSLTFTIEFDDPSYAIEAMHDRTVEGRPLAAAESQDAARREYVTRRTKYRIHQRTFRERVLRAYRSECALCHFRHSELLEAAHIIPDSDLRGEPRVSNGLALCRLHHGAFDRHLLGITPDLRVEIRPDLRTERDGPTLRHLLQELHGTLVHVPNSQADRPDPGALELRYVRFLEAGAPQAWDR